MTHSGISTSIESLVALRNNSFKHALKKKRSSKAPNAGQTQSRLRGRGLDFEETRHYQPGDELRSIDWRVTARTQVPHTKVFTEERERPVLIALDQRRSMQFGSRVKFKSVQAAELAALLIWSAQQRGDRVGGFIWNENNERMIKPRAGQSATIRLLGQIVAINNLTAEISTDTEGCASLIQVLKQVRVLAKPGTHLSLISDCWDLDDNCYRILYELKKHCDITIYQVFDQLEKQLPKASSLPFATTGGFVKLEANNKHVRKRFEQASRQREESLSSFCRKLGVTLIPVDAAADLENDVDIASKTRSARKLDSRSPANNI